MPREDDGLQAWLRLDAAAACGPHKPDVGGSNPPVATCEDARPRRPSRPPALPGWWSPRPWDWPLGSPLSSRPDRPPLRKLHRHHAGSGAVRGGQHLSSDRLPRSEACVGVIAALADGAGWPRQARPMCVLHRQAPRRRRGYSEVSRRHGEGVAAYDEVVELLAGAVGVTGWSAAFWLGHSSPRVCGIVVLVFTPPPSHPPTSPKARRGGRGP